MQADDTREALLRQLRASVERCGKQAAAEGLPVGLGQVDDVIVLLQPVRFGSAGEDQAMLESTLRRLAEKNFVTGTQAVGVAGLGAALVCGSAPRGFHADLGESEGTTVEEALFAERAGRALVSTRPKAHVPLANFVERGGHYTAEAVGRVTAGEIRIRWMGEMVLEIENFG